ncbi:run domain Beclin-1-interacting and cysteine-rich domain-containing protein-like [Paramacrobiotus metropolitanus]|uniref:run domain Beclin-1-interacting and cysteine-rich domain-containing protein-like n=1 Tax=Paramacrobiotus metropolitanus TaxID=2943436 RepID=UPI002445DFA8|nr:run domain Beclin-1-interacting and cysteine-rich domain-containing protein-like [Paramacrobiotus metropolitanus]
MSSSMGAFERSSSPLHSDIIPVLDESPDRSLKYDEDDNLQRVLDSLDSQDLVGQLEEACRVLLEIVPFLLPSDDDTGLTPPNTAADVGQTLAGGDVAHPNDNSLFQEALAVVCGDLANILRNGLTDPTCTPLLLELDAISIPSLAKLPVPSGNDPEISLSHPADVLRRNALFHRLITVLATASGHRQFVQNFLENDQCLQRLYQPFALLRQPNARQRIKAAVNAFEPFYAKDDAAADSREKRDTPMTSALSVSITTTAAPSPVPGDGVPKASRTPVLTPPSRLAPRGSTPEPSPSRLTVPPRPVTRLKQHTRSRSDGLPSASLPSRPSSSTASPHPTLHRMRSHHLPRTGTLDGTYSFSPPTEPGQSLLGYLQSQVDTETCADLERENAHFLISEAVICALEQMHYQRRHGGSDGSGGSSSGVVITGNGSGGSPVGSSDREEISLSSDDASVSDQPSSPSLSQSILRKNTVSAAGPAPLQNTHSAEAIAISLLKRFRESQIPSAAELEWLVAEEDVPEDSSSLLPLPRGVCVVPAEAHCSRIRGNLEWAPLRPQIIYHIQSHVNLKTALLNQKGRCAGCGGRMDAGQQQRMRYCEYTGKYFCVCCHEYKTSMIPARILQKWDFTKYYVSNFAADFISRIYRDPLFDVNDCNAGLYKKSKALMITRELRVQLVLANHYVRTCHNSQSIKAEIEQLPRVLSEQVHSYSLEMLGSVRDSILPTFLRPITELAIAHVTSCAECGARGFICEFCRDERPIFPFQLTTVYQCGSCGDCFHAKCMRQRPCPRCVRLQARRAIRERQTSVNAAPGPVLPLPAS